MYVCLLTPKQAIENIVNGVSMLRQLKVYIIEENWGDLLENDCFNSWDFPFLSTTSPSCASVLVMSCALIRLHHSKLVRDVGILEWFT